MTIVVNAPARSPQHPARPPRPAVRAPEPMPNWMKLSRKDEVEIYRHGELVASGRVDMLALDASVFWVVQNDGRGRTMFLHSDGFTVLRLPRARPAD
ncbi:hypothetical protein [Arthrobacter oryzae]|uniref:hypothetical protein n=1 Tax=Arthrobacter oryzae TaxID=409290 RepID=UPI0030C94952